MINKTNATILAVSLVVGVGTFVTTRPTNGASTTTGAAPSDDRPRWGRLAVMGQWLGLTEEQRTRISQQDPTFWREVIDLRNSLATERDRLAKLLEDPKSTDQQITDQVERVITLGNQLERRVMKHLLAVRGQLTPEQQQKLLSLCASGVRQGMGWHGGPPARWGPGRGFGGGFRGGWGQGPGPGNR